MLNINRLGTGVLLLAVTSIAQAVPVVSILSDSLLLNSQADLVNALGQNIVLEDSYTGEGYLADREVNAITDWLYSSESYGADTVYEEFGVTANANIAWGSSGFNLWAESDKYPSGMDQDTPPPDYYTSVGLQAMASLSLRFDVSGGNVEINYYVADEHVRNQVGYPTGYDESLSSIKIFDETTHEWIVDAAGWFTSGYATLLDGHTYRMVAIARDDHSPSRYLNEEDVDTGLYFRDAVFVAVAEPSSLLLLVLGLLMLTWHRRYVRPQDVLGIDVGGKAGVAPAQYRTA